ncbi:nucleotide sugar dehydrogenase [Flavobacteriaceae bacterium AU392]|nr:nucleotide sugar dehydrogenase [Flavobacteriaceae bacterium]RKM84856.1 nucleotide sugar dehydrogenase [Flavobacteriaceae bacterium AU392]
MKQQHKIAVIGLGYVGLPLAIEFSKKYSVIGFDVNQNRVDELNLGNDTTLEINNDNLNAVLNLKGRKGLKLSSASIDITNCNIYIVTVPTPIDVNNKPVLTPLIKASKTIGKTLKKGDIVIYESTVYPGVTEDICVPILEQVSGLKFNKDFYCGYSPERINPGDKTHTIANIKKVTSGSTPEVGEIINELYASIITAGTYLAPSIKVAEAAKVIENAQRDINIAFVNELAKIFNKLDIDTYAVLEAASTKWNFLSFKPGLVGGHCIGVDPYYLAQKAQEVGYHPEIILAGRRLNDSMGEYVATQVLKLMAQNNISTKSAKILMLGITFKENCPDIRNTKAVDVYNFLKSFNMNVSVYDPWASNEEVRHQYGFEMINELNETFDAIVHVVAHDIFQELEFSKLKKENSIIYDVKGTLNNELVNKRL